MAVNAETLLKRVRKVLDDEPWEDVLTAQYTAAAGSVTANQPTQWAEGDRMEFDDGGGNIGRVKATPAGNPVTIKAGHNDTTDATSINGTVILKNPEFEHDEILHSIQRTIDGLWPYVWVKDTENLTAAVGVNIYPIVSTTFKELISVTQDITPAATPTHFQVLRYGKDPGYPVSVLRDLPTTISASKVALWFQSFRTTPTATIVVTYARTIASTVSGGNYVDLDDGLMADMVLYGACATLLEGLEIQRDVDDVAQGDVNLTAGSRLRTSNYYNAKFEDLRYKMELQLKKTEPKAVVWER
jgi:hypothetical protein